MMFRLTFLFLALVSLVCLVMGARLKRRNIGFLITSALVVVCDIICFFLLGSKNVTGAKNVLIAFYIGYAWLYFGVVWTISAMGRYRYFKRCIFPAGLICIYQTVLMASNWFGSKILSFAKHIFLGRTWWIAEKSRSHTVFFSFSAYRGLLFVNTLIIIALMVACCINSAKLFRVKFYALGIAQDIIAGRTERYKAALGRVNADAITHAERVYVGYALEVLRLRDDDPGLRAEQIAELRKNAFRDAHSKERTWQQARSLTPPSQSRGYGRSR